MFCSNLTAPIAAGWDFTGHLIARWLNDLSLPKALYLFKNIVCARPFNICLYGHNKFSPLNISNRRFNKVNSLHSFPIVSCIQYHNVERKPCHWEVQFATQTSSSFQSALCKAILNSLICLHFYVLADRGQLVWILLSLQNMLKWKISVGTNSSYRPETQPWVKLPLRGPIERKSFSPFIIPWFRSEARSCWQPHLFRWG